MQASQSVITYTCVISKTDREAKISGVRKREAKISEVRKREAKISGGHSWVSLQVFSEGGRAFNHPRSLWERIM